MQRFIDPVTIRIPSVLLLLLLASGSLSAQSADSTVDAAAPAPDSPSPRLLTSLDAVHGRLRKNDSNDYEIDLTAHVNFWDRRWNSLFVQDDDDAVYVDLPYQFHSRVPDLALGDLLRIKGRFNPTQYVLYANTIERVSHGEPASPLDFDIESAKLGSKWARRVRVRGEVESVLVGFSRMQMVMCSGRRRFLVLAKERPQGDQPVAGSHVSVTGTISCLTDENDTAHVFLVHQMPTDSIETVTPAPTGPEAKYVSDYQHLIDPGDSPADDDSMYEIYGHVTYIQNFDFVIIENKQQQSLLVYAPFYSDLHVGDEVRMTGSRPPRQMPDPSTRHPLKPGSDPLGFGTHLIAHRTVISTTSPVAGPPVWTVDQIVQRQCDRVRAEVHGRFVSAKQSENTWHIVLDGQQGRVVCEIPADRFDAQKLNLDLAAQVQAVGIVFAPEQSGGDYTLKVEKTDDIRVTRDIPGVKPTTVIAVVAALVGLGLAIVIILRIQATRRERALARLAARLESSHQAIREGILVVDNQGTILSVNPRLCELLGIAATGWDQASGSLDALGELMASRFQGAEFRDFWRQSIDPKWIIESGEFKTAEPLSRTLIVQTTSVQDTYGSVDARIWVFDDISSQERLKANLIQSQKMESVGRLVGGVAHDFNNLLSVVLANLELLRIQPELQSPSVMSYVDAATGAIDSASQVAKNLLGFSRKSELTMRPRDVNDVVRQTVALLERSIDFRYSIALNLATDLNPCLIDENQVVQVLLNISINARDAMAPHGGVIRIETSHVTGDDLRESPLSQRSTEEAADRKYVLIQISDKGCGISESLMPKIFEPFFTTKPVGEGTGLGLAMSKGIIEQHGGDILVQSTPGVGTCFQIFLPQSIVHQRQSVSEPSDANLRSDRIPQRKRVARI